MFLEQKKLFEKIQNDLMIIQYTSVQKTFCFCKIFQEETNDLLERRIWEDHLTILGLFEMLLLVQKRPSDDPKQVHLL